MQLFLQDKKKEEIDGHFFVFDRPVLRESLHRSLF